MARGDIFTLDELNALEGSYATKTPRVTQAVDQPTGDFNLVDKVSEFGVGVGKSAAGTVLGAGQIGRKIQEFLPEPLAGIGPRPTDGASPFDTDTAFGQYMQESVEPKTKTEKFGKFVGDVAQFFVPGSKASKAQAVLPGVKGVLTRALSQAAIAGTVESLQEGEVGKDAVIAAGTAGAFSIASDAALAALNSMQNQLPEWLLRPLVKQTKAAKEQGDDITPFFVERGRIGSIDDLMQQSDEAGKLLETKVANVLTNSNKTTNLYDLAQSVADDINKAGGQTTTDDVLNIVQQQAFQSRGIINNAIANPTDDVAIANANSLRSQLDETLYAGKDYLRQVPTENKAILEMYTNTLRNTVQTSEPSTAPLFAEWSKEITLRNALNSARSSSQGRNALNIMDLMIGGGVSVGTGNPVTGLLAAGGRRLFETPEVKTTLAKAFVNTGPVIDALEAATPAVRATMIEFIDGVLESTEMQRQQQRQRRTQ